VPEGHAPGAQHLSVGPFDAREPGNCGAVGLALAFLMTRTLNRLLFDVGSLDPVAFAAVPALLGSVALLAAYIPVSALRSE